MTPKLKEPTFTLHFHLPPFLPLSILPSLLASSPSIYLLMFFPSIFSLSPSVFFLPPSSNNMFIFCLDPPTHQHSPSIKNKIFLFSPYTFFLDLVISSLGLCASSCNAVKLWLVGGARRVLYIDRWGQTKVGEDRKR